MLLHLPDYSDAQGKLNQMAVDWQVEIEMKLDAVERLEMAYRAERVLLTQEMRGKREEEIDTKRREARDLQKEGLGLSALMVNMHRARLRTKKTSAVWSSGMILA